jgi:S1-C subfamily serine protease
MPKVSEKGAFDMSTNEAYPDGQEFYIRIRGRILGPFGAEKLRSLRSRGQFSRVHEISTDRRTWSPASSVDHLFASAQTATSSTKGPVSTAGVASGSPEANHLSGGSVTAPPALAGIAQPTRIGPSDLAVWYYRANDEQFGPVTATDLRSLVSSGRLDRSEFAWRDGMLAWLAIQDVPELSAGIAAPQTAPSGSIADRIRLMRRKSRVAIAGFIFAIAAVGATIYFNLPKKLRLSLTTTATDLSSMLHTRGLTSIDGMDAERQLADCIGLVVTGVHATLQDGSVVEDAYGTGTCFVVDPDGYAITSKHVIDTVQKTMRAKLLRQKIRKELLMEIEPKVWVFFDAKVYSAGIASTSDNFDMAILKIDKQFRNYLRLSSQDSLARGEKVAALGFPGLDRTPLSDDELFQRLKNGQKKESIRAAFESRDFQFSRTDGTTSKVSKEQVGRIWIQHTAKINSGNSGGPLLTDDGLVWGINTLAFGGNEKADSPLFYAIAVGQMQEEIDQVVKDVEWK